MPIDANDMFLSSIRSTGDLAGMFEFDGDTAYFYLYVPRAEPKNRILNAVHIWTGHTDLTINDIAIGWDLDERRVGLFIRNQLWATFDGDRAVGGGYAVAMPLAQLRRVDLADHASTRSPS